MHKISKWAQCRARWTAFPAELHFSPLCRNPADSSQARLPTCPTVTPRSLAGANQRGCGPALLQWSGRGVAAAAPQAPMLTRRDAPGSASSEHHLAVHPRSTPPTINFKYSQPGLQLRRQGLSRISEALERKGSIWWPVPSCCSKDLLNNPGWIAEPVVSRRLFKSGLEWQWQSYLASSLQNIA